MEYLGIESPLNLSTVIPRRVPPSPHPPQRADSGQRSDTQADSEGATAAAAAACSNHTAPAANGDLSSRDPEPFDPRAIQDIASQDLLLPTILEHNKLQEDYEFKTTLFTCQVCFMEKLGALCLSFLNCDHVFCKECMKGYFEVQIEDGSVKALTCPSDKCESQAHPSQVSTHTTHRHARTHAQTRTRTLHTHTRALAPHTHTHTHQLAVARLCCHGTGSSRSCRCSNKPIVCFQVKELVSPELFARYDRLLLQSSLDTMSDVIYCPRKVSHCTFLFIIDNDAVALASENSGSDSRRTNIVAFFPRRPKKLSENQRKGINEKNVAVLLCSVTGIFHWVLTCYIGINIDSYDRST